MDDRGAFAFAFPRPRRGLTILLATIAALGIVTAFLNTWIPQAKLIMPALQGDRDAIFQGQLWRLVSSGLLTDPARMWHLIFTLLGLYFFGPDLEKRWGAWKFAGVLALAVAAGNALVLLGDAVMPAGDARFHMPTFYGAGAAIAAIVVAWSRENADRQALFFILPVRGKYLLWITLAGCVMNLIFPAALPEGVIAPFGGMLVGLLVAGSPSMARRAYLRTKLFLLRRQERKIRGNGDSIAPPLRPQKRSRPANAPPLRVVQGGLDEVLKNRKVPKDKRYLN